MKKIVIIFSVFLSLIACSQKNKENIQQNTESNIISTQQPIMIKTSLDIDDNTKIFILRILNNFNPNVIMQMLQYMSGLTNVAASIYVEKPINSNTTDLKNFVTDVGGSYKRAGNSLVFGIPLQFDIVSTSIVNDSTPYKQHIKVNIVVDDQSAYRGNELFKHSELIKKYNPQLKLGFLSGKDTGVKLTKYVVIGATEIPLDVTLFRKDVNTNWDSYIIKLDK